MENIWHLSVLQMGKNHVYVMYDFSVDGIKWNAEKKIQLASVTPTSDSSAHLMQQCKRRKSSSAAN